MNGAKLRGLRAERRVSVEQIAEVIGKSKPSYSKKESGEVKFTPAEVLAIVKFYGLSFEEMNHIFYDNKLLMGNIEELESLLGAMELL